jgi:hypothetical protein
VDYEDPVGWLSDLCNIRLSYINPSLEANCESATELLALLTALPTGVVFRTSPTQRPGARPLYAALTGSHQSSSTTSRHAKSSSVFGRYSPEERSECLCDYRQCCQALTTYELAEDKGPSRWRKPCYNDDSNARLRSPGLLVKFGIRSDAACHCRGRNAAALSTDSVASRLTSHGVASNHGRQQTQMHKVPTVPGDGKQSAQISLGLRLFLVALFRWIPAVQACRRYTPRRHAETGHPI